MASHDDAVRALAAYLSTLTRDRLTELLERRPESGFAPYPDSMHSLAERLLVPDALHTAILTVTRPQLQATEAAAALGDGCTRAELAGLLGVPVDDAGLSDALDALATAAIVWPSHGVLRHGGLNTVWQQPLRLGPSASTLLAQLTVADLRRIADAVGLPVGRGKADLVKSVIGGLCDGERVRALAAIAPADTRKLLQKLAWNEVSPYIMGYSTPPTASRWAVERGLLIKSGWATQMPSEVALALRGPDYHAPFDPVPPTVVTVPVDPDTVRREAAASVTATVAGLTAVVEAAGRAPVAVLKTGGIGVRELRRIAKAAGETEDRVRLYLEVAAAAGLIAVTDAGVVPTEGYDEYAGLEPAEQLLDLLDAWLELPASPLRTTESGRPAAALAWDEDGTLVVGLRSALLDAVVSLPPDVRVTAPVAVADMIAWHRPVLAGAVMDQLPRLVDGLWREAHQVGILAHGATTELCRSLEGGGDDAVLAEAKALMPPARGSVVLQADLTAVVTGVPSAALTSLLDGAADQESRSGAWTWRFSPASVRRALDGGVQADVLLARLAEVAEQGRVPQPLSYLIGDVARRHGHVRVRPVGCCLRSDDTVLLAEILRARSLTGLGLTELAPTVLASTAPAAETLAALRAAGYAPTGENPDGSRAIELTRRHRACPAPPRPSIEDMAIMPSNGRAIEMFLDLDGNGFDDAHDLSSAYPFDDRPALQPTDLALNLTRAKATSHPMR